MVLHLICLTPGQLISSAAFDFTITSPLTPEILGQSSTHSGFAAEVAKICKYCNNNAKCSELGWSCLLLAVETYGNWGKEAVNTFTLLSGRIAMDSGYTRARSLMKFNLP